MEISRLRIVDAYLCFDLPDPFDGDRRLTGLRLRDRQGDEPRNLRCSAVFVFIGARPRTAWMPPSIAVGPKGFVLTGAEAARCGRWPLKDREPRAVETTCPGVFAAGGVRNGSTKRVAFAVGDGALAVTRAHRVLAGLRFERVALARAARAP